MGLMGLVIAICGGTGALVGAVLAFGIEEEFVTLNWMSWGFVFGGGALGAYAGYKIAKWLLP